jgi:hypothetical protein
MVSANISAQEISYLIVHSGVSDFYDATAIIQQPSPDQSLFWQDGGRRTNPPDYTDNGDGTITDNVTGLMWQKNMGEKLSYSDAMIKADTATTGGYTDWRVPTIKELYSLILFTGMVKGETAISKFIDTVYFDQPVGDVSIGERTIDAQTWSSTQYRGLTMRGDTTVFGVNFIDGRIKGYPKYHPRDKTPNKMYFRMVRGNTSYGINQFHDNGNGTVTDNATGLMWQQADDGVARDWETSLAYCENLDLGDHSDWHLPNAKELQSLVDYSRGPQATDSPAIDPVFSTTEINDPDGNPGQYPYFWSATTHLDGPNPYDHAVYVAFGEAQGEMNGSLMDVHGAGAQRSDPKSGNPADYPKFHGPQGDVQYVNNYCRCVRGLSGSTTAKGSMESSDINIFPNPATDCLNISWPRRENIHDTSFCIFDASGRLCISVNKITPGAKIDISGLDPGLYIARIETAHRTVIHRTFCKSE